MRYALGSTVLGLVLIACAVFPQRAAAQAEAQAETQRSETATWAAQMTRDYGVLADVPYHKGTGHQSKLDLYLPQNIGEPVPVLVYFHGGGWVFGNKEGAAMQLMPYLEKGWAAISVGYRLASEAAAPAAVEDARCALRWVTNNAEEWKFDTDQIVVTGHSAGGHLALTTGLLSEDAGLDRACPGEEPLEVAGIVNWYGITDVGDLLEGEHRKSYAVSWLGAQPNRYEVAERVSPLTHVDADDPPVLTIHGDADPTVPYSHAVRLREALDEAGVPNRLVTIEGGGHGGFSEAQVLRAYTAIDAFLEEFVTNTRDTKQATAAQGTAAAEDSVAESSSEGAWISLFDGESLDGWRASENPETFLVEDGRIVVNGPRAHLFYTGPVQNHDFDDFEFKADVMTRPGSNSGIYFHTEYQEAGWPMAGYEVQVNNSFEGDPRRTASLYGVDDVREASIPDGEWFTMSIKVEGRRVVIKADGETMVDYTEPEDPGRSGSMAGRVLSSGTFALQGHDPGSTVYYKNIMVKPQ